MGRSGTRTCAARSSGGGSISISRTRLIRAGAAAVRVEWFRDRDGTRVSGLRAGNQTPTGLAGDFYEVTLGLNWKPRKNLRIRPEVRWDFFDPSPVTTNSAFDAGNLNRQFTFGCDLVYRF